MFKGDLQLSRDGNWVTLHSTHRPNWLVLPFSLIPGVILVNWLSEPGPADAVRDPAWQDMLKRYLGQ